MSSGRARDRSSYMHACGCTLRGVGLLLLSSGPACAVYEASLLDAGNAGSAGFLESHGGAEQRAGTAGVGSAAGSGAPSGTAGANSGIAGSGGSSNTGLGGANSVAGAAGSGPSAGAPSGGTGGASAGAGGAPQAGAPSAGAPGAGAPGAGGAPAINPCDRANWKASASKSSLATDPPQLYNPPVQAVDGMAGTRWSSGEAQAGGELFLIDLGARASHLTQVVLDTAKSASDFPVAYKLELSTDGTSYSSVASGAGAAVTTIKFTDKSARYLRITQTGDGPSWWSIHEVSITCQ